MAKENRDMFGKEMFMIVLDLYLLRFEKNGDKWYELTDYLREKLLEDGLEIRYTKDDLICYYNGNSTSMKEITKVIEDRAKKK